MGFRFRKRLNVGPFRMNFSKSGVGYSVGGKGFRVTKKAGGGYRTTASVPGSGISYSKDYPQNGKQVGKMKKTTQSQKGKKPHNWKAWGIGIAAVLVIGIIGIIADGGKENPEQSPSPSISVSAAGEPSASTPAIEPSSTPSPSAPEASEPVQETQPGNTESTPEPEDPATTESLTTAPSVVPSAPAASEPNEPEASASQQPEQQEMVWVSGSGEKYHNDPNCSNMKNPHQISLDEAVAAGRTPCSKCY